MTIEVSGIILGGSIGGGGGSATSLSDLSDVLFSGVLQNGQYLRYNGILNVWQNSNINSDVYNYIVDNLLGTNGITVNSQNGKHYIGFNLTASGDVAPTSVSDGNLTLHLVDVNNAPGTYGGVTQVPVITIDSKGRVTNITTTTVAGGGTVTSVNVLGGSTGLTTMGGPIVDAGEIILSGVLNTESGGTGASSLSGYLYGNGTDPVTGLSSIPGADIVGDISGNAASVTGIVALENGGTGVTTATEALNVFLPAQPGNAGKILKTDGSNAFWESVAGTGTVTSVTIDAVDGIDVFGSPITAEGTITLSLGDITPSSITASGPIVGTNLTGTNTGDQTITLTGDVTGSGTGTFSATLADTGVISGTYGDDTNIPQITVDSKGRITSVVNVSIAESGLGTVSSVDVVGGTTGLTTTGGPITTTGVITLDGILSAEHGGTGVDSLTGYVVGNGTSPFTSVTSIPGSDIVGDISGNSTNVTGIVAVSNGGTGVDNVQGIIDLVIPDQTGYDGFVLSTNNNVLNWIEVSGVGTVTDLEAFGTEGVNVSVTTPTTIPNITIGLGDITPASVAAAGTVSGSNLSGTNTGDQTITLTGDVTGSGTGEFSVSLSNTGVTAGIYGSSIKVPKITVDDKGRILGVTEEDISGTGFGTVTSVDVSGGTTGLTATGGPITSNGIIELGGTLNVEHGGTGANTITGYLYGNGTDPVTGLSSIPGADIQGDISGNAANVTGIVAIEHGGTGATTLDGILNNALPDQTGQDGKYFKTDGVAGYWGSLTHNDVTVALMEEPVELAYLATQPQGNSFYIRRDTDYIGGTAGWVNSALFIDTYTGPETQSFEWGLTSRMNNYSAYGENVGGYLQGNKFSTGPTWGACVEVNDKTGSGTTSGSGGTVGLEVDVWANGLDGFKQRIGVDVVVGKSNQSGPKSYAYAGLRIGAQNNQSTLGAFLNGIEITSADDSSFLSTATGARGIDLRGNYSATAIDLSNAITSTGTAIRLRSGSSISFANDAYRTRYIDTRIEFLNGGTRKAYIDLTAAGDIQLNRTYVNSVSISANDGIIGTVTSPNDNPVITLGLGDITPTSIASTGVVTGSNLSGVNTGDQTIVLTGDVTGSGKGSFVATLAEVNLSPQTDSFRKITVNSKGLITGTSAVTANDIETALAYTPINKAGDTVLGDLSFGNTFTVTDLPDPTAGSDAATKNYVDNAITGLSWKHAVTLLSNSNVALSGVSGALVIDGISLSSGNDSDRILVIGQTVDEENGVYVYTDDGSNYLMVRSADTDIPGELVGAGVYVLDGNQYANTGWTQSAQDLTTFAGQSWTQFSGNGAYSAGTGISISGNVISNSGVTSLASSNPFISVSQVTGAASLDIAGTLPISNGGTGQTTSTGAFNALAPAQTGNSGKFLTTDGNNTSWTSAVTSVSMTGGTTGLAVFGGPITTSGTLTLGGTLAASNGGTGSTSITGIVKGNGTSPMTNAVAGSDYVSPSVATNFTATQTFSGSNSVFGAIFKNSAETVQLLSFAASMTIYTSQGPVVYFTSNATNNWSFDYRFSSTTTLGSAMSVGQSVSIALLVPQGATPCIPVEFYIDGALTIPKWLGGTGPVAGNANSIDMYAINIIRTSTGFVMLASQLKYA